MTRKTWIQKGAPVLVAAVSMIALASGCVSESKYKQEVALADRYAQLNRQLQTEVGSDQAEIKQLEGQLKMTLADEILFPEGSARMSRKGEETLNKIVPTLADLKNTKVQVDGYTDNLPIAAQYRKEYPSNWELSTARASDVVRHLQTKGVDPGLLSANGYGDNHPVAPNSTLEGRAKNRRIEVTLLGNGT